VGKDVLTTKSKSRPSSNLNHKMDVPNSPAIGAHMKHMTLTCVGALNSADVHFLKALNLPQLPQQPLRSPAA